MLAASFKRTKIVATIGPASSSPACMEQLMKAGVNCFRFNFSHGTHAEHGAWLKQAREVAVRVGRPLATMADLQGPKIQVGSLPPEGVKFEPEAELRFAFGADYDRQDVIPVMHDISGWIQPGQHILLRDGQLGVEVNEVKHPEFTAKVIIPGTLYSGQGMNLPHADMRGEFLTEKDLADMEFAVKQGFDYLALSFVQRPQDLHDAREKIKEFGGSTPIIVKFETRMAADHLEEIVKAADVVMVARGDLAVETSPEQVPILQRELIRMGQKHKRPVIVATQMLESMMAAPSPTRAEVSDIATAVFEGADAVMLSGETAKGEFPVETVKLMKRVLRYTEDHSPRPTPYNFGENTRENAISGAAIILASQVGAKVIIAETATGKTARNLSSFRPAQPIIMVTHDRTVYNRMAIYWGGKSFLHEKPGHVFEEVIRQLKEAGNVTEGDLVVAAWGTQPGVPGGTDTVRVLVVQ